MTGQQGEQKSVQMHLQAIEAKLDEVLEFRDLLLEVAGPWLRGRNLKMMAVLTARSRR